MILDDIAGYRREQLAREQAAVSASEMRRLAEVEPRPVLDFYHALKDGGLSIIAEVKKASPSKSVICADFHPVEQAIAYQAAGANAISCLTEEHYFQGSSQYLRAIRQAVQLPILRKDFIIDSYQIDEARVIGADAVLLIAAMLDLEQMQAFYAQASALGLHCLFEVHNEAELEQVLRCKPKIIGINNRNLKTFQVDLNTTKRLAKLVPSSCVLISESGISQHADMQQAAESSAHAVLIGETLMRSGTVADTMHMLREGL